MSETSPPLQVLCRPALERDIEEIKEFCKTIWDGDDYVPDVIDDWFHDSDGLCAVAQYEGHAIGFAKLTRLSAGQWWMEGFRVDPKHQGRKVGSRIHHYVTDWWQEQGDGTLRLMTDAGNFAVHHLCDQTGYAKTHEVCGYKATPIAEPTANFSRVIDTSEAATFAIKSESIKTTGGRMDLGWRIVKPDKQVFEVYSGDDASFVHTFYWWKDKQGVLSAWVDEDDEKRTLVLGVVACALSNMPVLLMDVRRLAAHQKFDSIFQIAFDIPQIISQLVAAGFEKRWKRSNAFVFEKRHPRKA